MVASKTLVVDGTGSLWERLQSQGSGSLGEVAQQLHAMPVAIHVPHPLKRAHMHLPTKMKLKDSRLIQTQMTQPHPAPS